MYQGCYFQTKSRSIVAGREKIMSEDLIEAKPDPKKFFKKKKLLYEPYIGIEEIE